MFIQRIGITPGTDTGRWPFTIPAIAQLTHTPLQLHPGVTFLVGENGSGKSTLIEAIAEAVGIDHRGGRAKLARTTPSRTELSQHLDVELTAAGRQANSGRRRKTQSAYFLRAETAFDLLEFISSFNIIVPGYWQDDLRIRSHGESFLTVLDTILAEPGLYLLDEPEAALSFQSSLRLLALLDHTARVGSQVICATHSPILAALPHAQILELGPGGLRTTTWTELELVEHWQQFLTTPDAYLRHLIT